MITKKTRNTSRHRSRGGATSSRTTEHLPVVREKSVGVLVYRVHPQEGVQFLVLYHRGTYWNFPKGRTEEGESEMETGLRELREETGVTGVTLIDGWRQQTHFFFREERHGQMVLIKKDFVMYLAQTPLETPVTLSSEQNGYAWFDYSSALKYVKFKNLKSILNEAQSLIERQPATAAASAVV